MLTKAQRAALDALLKKWEEQEEELRYPIKPIGEIQECANRELRNRLENRRDDLQELLELPEWRVK